MKAFGMSDMDAVARATLGLGLESKDISVLQMSLRAVIVYTVTVLIVRLGKKRFMGGATAFDVMLGWAQSSAAPRQGTLHFSRRSLHRLCYLECTGSFRVSRCGRTSSEF